MTHLKRRTFLAYGLTVPFAAGLATTARAATTHNVTIKGFKFSPAEITINAGDTVRWTNQDSAPHTADDAGEKWKTGTLKRGQTGDVTFDTKGSFNYVCKFHPDMKGRVKVT